MCHAYFNSWPKTRYNGPYANVLKGGISHATSHIHIYCHVYNTTGKVTMLKILYTSHVDTGCH